MEDKNWKNSWKDNWKGKYQSRDDGYFYESEFTESEEDKQLRELKEARDRGNPIATWKLRQRRNIIALILTLLTVGIIWLFKSCGN